MVPTSAYMGEARGECALINIKLASSVSSLRIALANIELDPATRPHRRTRTATQSLIFYDVVGRFVKFNLLLICQTILYADQLG